MQAFSLPVSPFHAALVQFVRDSVDDPLLPRSASLPDGEVETADPEDEEFMVSLTELLMVVVLAAHQCLQWKGEVVLYMGDNQVVIAAWVRKRQAKHPMPATCSNSSPLLRQQVFVCTLLICEHTTTRLQMPLPVKILLLSWRRKGSSPWNEPTIA